MKEIIAIIRMNKVSATKKALVDAGFCGLTALKVMGRGKMLKDLALLQQAPDEARDMLLESMLKGGRLIPKRMLTIVVPDDKVQTAVDTIIAVNKEGNIGDGKIFVSPVLDAVTVRTGQRGEAAV